MLLAHFMDGFVDGSPLNFLEVLKDARILRISPFLATELGVFPLFGALGLSVKGAKILTISVCPLYVAIRIGVSPYSSGALGLSVKGAKIFTISVFSADENAFGSRAWANRYCQNLGLFDRQS